MTTTATGGDADLSVVASLMADRARTRVLLALTDGRALPASVLADEAGISASAASSHLAKLLAGELVTVQRSGRHRYYRLAGPEVAAAIEALARLAPAQPVRSLRQGTRAHALRRARSCYDHLAGRLGVAATTALIEHGVLVPLDGRPNTARRDGDPLAAPSPNTPYELAPDAASNLEPFGVDLPTVQAGPSRRPILRFCVDWSEQQHHLAGRLGAALATAWFDHGWITRPAARGRALRLTDTGAHTLHRLGINPSDQ